MGEYEVVFSLTSLFDESQLVGITNKDNPLRPKVLLSWSPTAVVVVVVAVLKPQGQQREDLRADYGIR